MKLMAVIILFLGCMAIFRPEVTMDNADMGKTVVIATNFAIWRNAVLEYVLTTKTASGEIPLSALRLPTTWTPLRSWTARVTGGVCYAFGPASAPEIAAVQSLFHGSASIGRVEGGHLVSLYSKTAPVSGVPEGYLVSVIRID